MGLVLFSLLALTLLVLRVDANHEQLSLSFHDFAMGANFLHG